MGVALAAPAPTAAVVAAAMAAPAAAEEAAALVRCMRASTALAVMYRQKLRQGWAARRSTRSLVVPLAAWRLGVLQRVLGW